eukprot:12549_1
MRTIRPTSFKWERPADHHWTPAESAFSVTPPKKSITRSSCTRLFQSSPTWTISFTTIMPRLCQRTSKTARTQWTFHGHSCIADRRIQTTTTCKVPIATSLTIFRSLWKPPSTINNRGALKWTTRTFLV